MDNEEFSKKLGQKIRILRENKNIPQDKLALSLNIDPSYLSKVEKGKANPSVYYLKGIAEALEIDIKELFNFVI